MPPRQPLKPRTTAKKPLKRPGDSAATAALTASLLESHATSTSSSRTPAFSPYPDLAMAIEMLNKRAKNLAANTTEPGDRHALIIKWMESLQKIQEEMQKLHKLEILANRLISPK
jgi:hypothetical protein